VTQSPRLGYRTVPDSESESALPGGECEPVTVLALKLNLEPHSRALPMPLAVSLSESACRAESVDSLSLSPGQAGSSHGEC
jgi:hypothetical protein